MKESICKKCKNYVYEEGTILLCMLKGRISKADVIKCGIYNRKKHERTMANKRRRS